MLRPGDGNVRTESVGPDLAPKAGSSNIRPREPGEVVTIRKALAAATTVLLMLVIASGAAAVEGSRYEEASGAEEV
jgi:hypothetical protein